MFEIFEWLGHAYQAYRATQDAGLWMFQAHTQQTQDYMESSLISQGRL